MRLKFVAIIILALILILAIGTRIFAAQHTDYSSDEMIYSLMPLNIISAERLSTVEQSPVAYYLADLGYKMFGGLTAVSGRLTSIFFGSLSVIVVFLLALEIFGRESKDQNSRKKGIIAGLAGAFIFALSGYALTFNYETDMPAFFFLGLSILFMIKSFRKIEHSGEGEFFLSIVFLAIGGLCKILVLTAIPIYLGVISYHLYNKGLWGKLSYSSEKKLKINKINLNKRTVKLLLFSMIIFLVAVSPILIYNLFNYTQNGVTDFYFSTMLGLGDNIFSGQETKAWSTEKLVSITESRINTYLKIDLILLIFGLLGVILVVKKIFSSGPVERKSNGKEKESRDDEENYGYDEETGLKYFKSETAEKVELSEEEKEEKKILVSATALLLGSMLILYLYLAGKTGSGTHYLIIPLFLSVFAGYGWMKTYYFVQARMRRKGAIFFGAVVMLVAIVISLNTLSEIEKTGQESVTLALREYVIDNIPAESLVVMDPRIYRGINAWVFHDRHYVEGSNFPSLVQAMDQIPGDEIMVPLVYLECKEGSYCGWKPEDFARVDDFGKALTKSISATAAKVGEVKWFNIYKGQMQIPTETYDLVDRTHSLWYTPVGWKFAEEAVDTYHPETLLGKGLNLFGFLILYLEVGLALLSVILLGWMVKKGI
jgi:hypothetical protein